MRNPDVTALMGVRRSRVELRLRLMSLRSWVWRDPIKGGCYVGRHKHDSDSGAQVFAVWGRQITGEGFRH